MTQGLSHNKEIEIITHCVIYYKFQLAITGKPKMSHTEEKNRNKLHFHELYALLENPTTICRKKFHHRFMFIEEIMLQLAK